MMKKPVIEAALEREREREREKENRRRKRQMDEGCAVCVGLNFISFLLLVFRIRDPKRKERNLK